MNRLLWTEIKSLLPTGTIAAGLPFVIRAALPEDAGFAFLGLGLGCALLAAKASRRSDSRSDGLAATLELGRRREESDLTDGRSISLGQWLQRPSASSPRRPRDGSKREPLFAALILAFGAAAVFTLFGAAHRNPAGLPLPLLAALTVVPALGIVPYLTFRTGRPFAAIVFSAFIVGMIKLASCVVVRIVYGPDALADGYMAGDWQTAKLMISLFWVGTVTLSIILGFACHRRVSNLQPTPVPA